jgi:hypothetical protein
MCMRVDSSTWVGTMRERVMNVTICTKLYLLLVSTFGFMFCMDSACCFEARSF